MIEVKYLFSELILLILEKVKELLFVYCRGGIFESGFVLKVFLRIF